MADNLKTSVSDNAAGAVAYITLFPALIFLFLPPYNKSSYIRFHAWQSIILDILLGLIILAHWPVSSLWTLGIFLGVDLVFAGASWIGIGIGLRQGGPV